MDLWADGNDHEGDANVGFEVSPCRWEMLRGDVSYSARDSAVKISQVYIRKAWLIII